MNWWICKRFVRMVVLILVLMAVIPGSAAVQAAPAQQPTICNASVSISRQSSSSVVATASISCTFVAYIDVDLSLQGPNGPTLGGTTCYGSEVCSASLSAPFSYGTWVATAGGTEFSIPLTIQTVSYSATFVQPQPAYYLRLDSIECFAKNDLVGYDEPRLYVNGIRVWSHEHFDRGQTASLTHIAPIPFGGNSTLPITLQEYDAWPGSTVTIPTLVQPGYIDRTVGTRSLDFVRGDFRTWYVLYYTVVYQ